MEDIKRVEKAEYSQAKSVDVHPYGDMKDSASSVAAAIRQFEAGNGDNSKNSLPKLTIVGGDYPGAAEGAGKNLPASNGESNFAPNTVKQSGDIANSARFENK